MVSHFSTQAADAGTFFPPRPFRKTNAAEKLSESIFGNDFDGREINERRNFTARFRERQ